MSKDKYRSIFSPQMEAIVFIILQIFYATRAMLKIEEYLRIFPSFSWGIFARVTRLDQLRVSENIWWIISRDITGSTLCWGFFSGYSGFPHSTLKHNWQDIVEGDWDKKFFDYFIFCNTNMLLSVYFLVTCAHMVEKSPLQLLLLSRSKLSTFCLFQRSLF